MVKRAHHRSAVRHVLAGTIGTLGALAVSTQVASANHVIVKAGDTVWNIAQEHHSTVSALENANANTIKKVSDSVDLIYAGQQLTLPGSDTTMQADENGCYTVKPGDTLSKIAENFHVSVATLMAWNGLTSNQLYIGQQLIVDGQSAVVVSVANTTPAAPVASAAPATSQGNTVVATAPQAPVQSAGVSATQQDSTSAVQQGTPASTSTAVSDGAGVVAANTSASTSTVASATAQLAESTTINSTSSSAASQATVASGAVTTSSATSEVEAESAATTMATASTTAESAVTTTSAASASPVSTTPTSGASESMVASTATTPASTTPESSATASVSATPQPVASQAITSQAPASQEASQAPAQASQAATSTAPAQPQSSASQDLHSGSVVSLAVKVANTNSVPYVWGGSSLSGMDCSGLVDYVYANAEGKQLPHNTVALESCVNQHSVSEAQPGDILFWGQHGATYHCAIYTGNNQFVAAAKPGTNVASYTISPYFEPSFAGTVK